MSAAEKVVAVLISCVIAYAVSRLTLTALDVKDGNKMEGNDYADEQGKGND